MKVLFLMTLLAPAAQASEFCVCEARPIAPQPDAVPAFASYEYHPWNEAMCYGMARNWSLRLCKARNHVQKCQVVGCERKAN